MNEQAKTYVLLNALIASNASKDILSRELGKYELTISPIRKDKTKKQLGGIFGVWVKYLAEQSGESEDFIHKKLKSMFLGRIYATGPQGQFKDEQENWLDSIALHQQNGDMDKLTMAANRLSLSWASLDQTKAYMTAVEQHYQSIGEPLPTLDRFYKSMCR